VDGLKDVLMLVTNANLITWEIPNRVLPDYALYIQDGRIKEIGPCYQMQSRYHEVNEVDAGGQYVMPGNICAHTHFYGAFARGMNIPGQAPANFLEILRRLWWPLDMALDEDAIRVSALVCLLDAIRHGTSLLFDHHASPSVIPGSLEILAQAVERSGLRAVLCYEVTDRNGEEGALAGIEENLRFIKKTDRGEIAPGRIAATFGLHASLTLSDHTLDLCRQVLPSGVGVHIHVAEASVDQDDSLAKSGIRIVKRLQHFDFLGPHSIFAHAVHVDADEINRIAESGTWVTHQPRSNMNNAVGMSDVESMLRAGVKVCLGNDGFSNAMWEEWKTAYLAHKAWKHDPRAMSALDVVQMGVYHNAALARQFFPGSGLGMLAPGTAADMIFIDYKPYTPLTVENLPWHIIFGFHESMITSLMVDGKFIMRDRRILTLDENAIVAEARQLAPQVWQRYEQYLGRY
jgi:putative selenium metabolism protein SsnA